MGYKITDSDRVKAKVIDIKTRNNHDTYSVGGGTENVDMEVETKSRLYSLNYDKDIGDSRGNISLL